MGLGGDDASALRHAREVVTDQLEAIVDVWYGSVAADPHLALHFTNRTTGELDGRYLARVRDRFAQWILDTTSVEREAEPRPVERVEPARARIIDVFLRPLTAAMEFFLRKRGHSAHDVRRISQAWTNAALLSRDLPEWLTSFSGLLGSGSVGL